nr:MAG: disulfide bond formation protein DsbB [Candidatus Nanosalinarum sp. J07AB56]
MVEQPVVYALAAGAAAIHASLLAAVSYFAASRAGYRVAAVERLKSRIAGHWRELSLVLATLATGGSLYMSQVLGWTPCKLCWYIRIAIYPLVVLFATALFLDRQDVREYVIPLLLVGIPISAYHYAIQRIDQFTSAGCSVLAVSCSTEYTFHFGYINISMLSLTAQLAILVLAWRFGRN